MNINGVDKYLDFSDALKKLKEGCKLTRLGWNGKDMFVYLVPAGNFKPYTPIAETLVNEDGLVPYNPYFAIRTVNGSISTWVPSVNDCLAEDWYILK